MWKPLRIAVLLVVLAIVAGRAWFDRHASTSWSSPLWVGLFPIDGDGSAVTADYLASLSPASFASIGEFFDREGGRYRLRLEHPVRILLYPPVPTRPPALARDSGALATIIWSLRLRVYAWRAVRAVAGPAPAVRIFVLYHDPSQRPTQPHSLGLQKGLIGVVYAFASRAMQGGNAIVVTHELLHTLGATDEYDPRTLQPRYPDGYAEPGREPLFPQPLAEIMAGRRALSADRAQMPGSLDEVVVGPATAREIRWRDR
jgi:hypothetical protein